MRQFICIFSAFALLIGCVKIDPTTTTGQESEAVIAFESPIVAPKVKSVTEFKSYPDDLNFRVWGFYSEDVYPVISNETILNPYIVGAEFTKNGNVWSPAGERNYYWLKNLYLHFFAYAPANPKVTEAFRATVNNVGLRLDKYTVPNTADEDLLVSDVAYACTKPLVEGAGIQLQFHHALSSVVFKVNSSIYGDRNDEDENRIDTDLRVTKIEIMQARKRGVFRQQLKLENQQQMGEPSVRKGWYVHDDAPRQNYVGYKSVEGAVLTDEFIFCHDKQLTAGDEDNVYLTNLMLLPQEIKDYVLLQVTYDMTHSNMPVDDTTGERIWIKDQIKTVQLNQCGVTEWLRGTRYCYNISLGLNKIQCSAEVSDWSTTDITTDVEDLDVEDVVEL